MTPLDFIEQHLIDPETDKPFALNDAEKLFLKHAFNTDRDGRLLYPELIYSAPKKSGKTGFAAMICLYATLHFGKFGEGYCLANDLEQSTGRVFTAVRRIVEASPVLKKVATIQQSKIEFSSPRATIQAIASDYAGAAGSNPTISVFDELWGYTSERSRRLWDEMVPPPTRKQACRLTVTYAGFEGESSLLEELYRRGLRQEQIGPDLYAGDGLLMFWSHTPVAPWQTPQWIEQMRKQHRPNAFLRQIENRFVTSESTFVDMEWWDACVDQELRPVIADKDLPIWVGVDASVKRDSTAIVAVTWDREKKHARLVMHRVFQPTGNDPLDFEATIEATIRDLRLRFSLREVRFDPYQMQAVAQRLQRDGVRMVEFAQSVPNLTEASTNLYELIKGRNLVVYPDADTRLSISRAVALETTRGWRIAKEKTSHKIDVVVALGMAALGAVSQGEIKNDTVHCAPILADAQPRYFPGSPPAQGVVAGAASGPRGNIPSHWLRSGQAPRPWLNFMRTVYD
jgi:phage terminase large subunit-like protein